MGDPNLAFEHKVIGPLKGLAGGDWLIAVSGGVDSMVLAEVLFRWRRLLKVRLHVAHVHHGMIENKKQKLYRNRAQKRVRAWCAEKEIPFLTNSVEAVELKSEAALREYRQRFLKVWQEQANANLIVLAHHRDDLLETRILRLIRGTGTFGLRGMHLKRGEKLRPLLECSRAEIENYAHSRGLIFVTDPSNKSTDSLRNWVRRAWLPALEKKQAGASASLSRSLEILSANAVVESRSNVVRRAEIAALPMPAAEKIVAGYLRNLGLKNYSRRHVRELIKRMNSPQKNRTFSMLGVDFRVTPDLLVVTRV